MKKIQSFVHPAVTTLPGISTHTTIQISTSTLVFPSNSPLLVPINPHLRFERLPRKDVQQEARAHAADALRTASAAATDDSPHCKPQTAEAVQNGPLESATDRPTDRRGGGQQSRSRQACFSSFRLQGFAQKHKSSFFCPTLRDPVAVHTDCRPLTPTPCLTRQGQQILGRNAEGCSRRSNGTAAPANTPPHTPPSHSVAPNTVCTLPLLLRIPERAEYAPRTRGEVVCAEWEGWAPLPSWALAGWKGRRSRLLPSGSMWICNHHKKHEHSSEAIIGSHVLDPIEPD